MNTIRAIIADDERLSREYIKQLIAGYNNVELVSECKNGLEAVNAVFTHQPDLIFLDIQMPDLNGFEVIAEIKKEIPEFEISYEPDFRQAIADSWPASIDDSVAKKDWGLTYDFGITEMTKDMIKNLKVKLGK